jgi:pSer/pThr/pTyr-binding forkhead associated (FHA) protein
MTSPPPKPPKPKKDPGLAGTGSGVFTALLTNPNAGPTLEERTLLLVVMTGRHRGRSVEVSHADISMGRASDCDLRLAKSIGVSRRHAKLTCQDGQYFIEDTGSRNGVLLNHDLIEVPTPVKPGDVIFLDEEQILFDFKDQLDAAATSGEPLEPAGADAEAEIDMLSIPVTDPRAHERFPRRKSSEFKRKALELQAAENKSKATDEANDNAYLDSSPKNETRKFNREDVVPDSQTLEEVDLAVSSIEDSVIPDEKSPEMATAPPASAMEPPAPGAPLGGFLQTPPSVPTFVAGAAIGLSLTLGLGYLLL